MEVMRQLEICFKELSLRIRVTEERGKVQKKGQSFTYKYDIVKYDYSNISKNQERKILQSRDDVRYNFNRSSGKEG